MFNLVEKRRWYYLFSTLVILPGLVAMIYATIDYGSPVRLGVDFESGSRFVETLLSVIETCRQQKRNVLNCVTDAVTAHLTGKTAPSLLTGV